MDLNHWGLITALEFITSVKIRVKFDLCFALVSIQRDCLYTEVSAKILIMQR